MPKTADLHLHVRDFDAACARFLESMQQTRKLAAFSQTAYAADLQQFAAYLDAEGHAGQISRLHIRGYLSELIALQSAPATINRKLSALRSLFRFLLRENAITVNPCANIVSRKQPAKLPELLSQQQIFTALDNFESSESLWMEQKRTLVELFYGTGLRLREATGLRLDAINLHQRQLRVLGKGGKMRIVPLPARLAKTLSRWMGLRSTWLTQAGKENCDWLFINKSGGALNPRTASAAVNAVLAQVAEKGKTHPHTLRHSYATHLVDGGADLMAVKELLGHTSLTTTQKYIHVSPARLQASYLQAHPRAQASCSDQESCG